MPLSYARVGVSHAEVVLPHGYMSSLTNVFKLLPVRLLMRNESGGEILLMFTYLT